MREEANNEAQVPMPAPVASPVLDDITAVESATEPLSQQQMSAGDRERIQHVLRRVRFRNQHEVRVLADAWGVPQKAAGKHRSVPDMRRDLEEKIGTALAEPLARLIAAQGERLRANHEQATVLAEPVAAQREGQEGEEGDARDLEVQTDRGLSAEPHEAMVLAKPVGDQGDDGVARKVA